MSEEQDRFSRYSSIEFRTNQVVEGFITGLHKSPFHGFSVEFAEHRLYNTGESTRHIDWRLYARTDKLFVKKFEEETNLRCMLMVDDSSSMLFPYGDALRDSGHTKLSFALYACGVIIHMLYRQRDAFGLSFISDKVEYVSEIKTSFAHKQRLFAMLEEKLHEKQVEAKQTKIDDILHRFAEQIHKRSLIIIFTDLFSTLSSERDLTDALQHLKHNKHEVILFHVCDNKREMNLEFDGRPYRFVDMETNQQIKLSVEQVKDSYRKQVMRQSDFLRSECNRLKIDFVQADINRDFDQILLPYMLKRARLK